MNPPTAAKRSRGRRVLGLVFALLLVLLCLLGLLVGLGWHGRPAHWDHEQARLAALPNEQRQAISESLRNRLLKQWSDFGNALPTTPDELFGHERTIEIPFDDLNTWIQIEGIDLLTKIGVEVPKTATTAMIDSPGGGLLRISFEITDQGLEQVVTLSFAVTIDEQDGTLTSTLKQATAGKLPLPVTTAIGIIASQANEGILIDLMQGTPIDPIQLPIDASDTGRDGRLIGLEVTETALVITRLTVPRENKQ